ncbi:hypothetical protein LOAG_14994, partial [Loa loa]
ALTDDNLCILDDNNDDKDNNKDDNDDQYDDNNDVKVAGEITNKVMNRMIVQW